MTDLGNEVRLGGSGRWIGDGRLECDPRPEGVVVQTQRHVAGAQQVARRFTQVAQRRARPDVSGHVVEQAATDQVMTHQDENLNAATPPFIGGNYFDKYRSKNPIHQLLMRGFLASARNLLSQIDFESILEVGCGPGDLASRILPPECDYLGIDIDASQVELAKHRYPQLEFTVGSAYELPVESKSRDLVIACEVFEHLVEPEKALAEIARVAKRWVLISVPWEPAWRILNVARGKYWSSFANTPGHVQHFSRRAIQQLIRIRIELISNKRPFPWTMILGKTAASKKSILAFRNPS